MSSRVTVGWSAVSFLEVYGDLVRPVRVWPRPRATPRDRAVLETALTNNNKNTHEKKIHMKKQTHFKTEYVCLAMLASEVCQQP